MPNGGMIPPLPAELSAALAAAAAPGAPVAAGLASLAIPPLLAAGPPMPPTLGQPPGLPSMMQATLPPPASLPAMPASAGTASSETAERAETASPRSRQASPMGRHSKGPHVPKRRVVNRCDLGNP
eukprot:7378388-Prymnesium_polylepis.1